MHIIIDYNRPGQADGWGVRAAGRVHPDRVRPGHHADEGAIIIVSMIHIIMLCVLLLLLSLVVLLLLCVLCLLCCEYYYYLYYI